jgi:hypothetical protein
MFDLPYIVTHPLLATIIKRCAVLSEEADALPQGSAARKELEKRISQLEQYKLPKPDARDLEESEPILNDSGQKIGESHSLRRRVIAKRRGRPEEFRIRTRAALEEKLAPPRTTWRELAVKHHFQDRKDLERFVRHLKEVLRREGIALPTEKDYTRAAAQWAQLFARPKK